MAKRNGLIDKESWRMYSGKQKQVYAYMIDNTKAYAEKMGVDEDLALEIRHQFALYAADAVAEKLLKTKESTDE